MSRTLEASGALMGNGSRVLKHQQPLKVNQRTDLHPGTSGMMMMARHGVPSECAAKILDTSASPILFSIMVPSISVEVMKNWFSMYTK